MSYSYIAFEHYDQIMRDFDPEYLPPIDWELLGELWFYLRAHDINRSVNPWWRSKRYK